MAKKNTLVVVAAQAADAELNAGGTMSKWAADGEVVIVLCTNNCSGEVLSADGSTRRLPAAETSALRDGEQDAAAALIGARVVRLNYAQRHYFDGAGVVRMGYGARPPAGVPPEAYLQPLLTAYQLPEHVARMAETLAGLSPSLILCQPPSDLDPEHHATAALVWAAWAGAAPLASVPLRFYTPGSSCPGGLFRIHYDVLEDISEYFEKKLELCGAHASQMTAPRWKMVRERAAAFGKAAGVAFAEPFVSALRRGEHNC